MPKPAKDRQSVSKVPHSSLPVSFFLVSWLELELLRKGNYSTSIHSLSLLPALQPTLSDTDTMRANDVPRVLETPVELRPRSEWPEPAEIPEHSPGRNQKNIGWCRWGKPVNSIHKEKVHDVQIVNIRLCAQCSQKSEEV